MIDLLNNLVSMVSVNIFVISNWETVLGLGVTSHRGQCDGLAGKDKRGYIINKKNQFLNLNQRFQVFSIFS